jgi:hypothetical protein
MSRGGVKRRSRMTRASLIAVLLLIPAMAAATLEAYPTTSLAELATATWCGYCPDAYAGLDVVHAAYDYSEFISARYYASSGSYGTAETDAAIAYYGVTGYPTAIINGTQRFVGGGTTIATGLPYLGAVAAAFFAPSPVRVEIDSLDVATGYVRATVTMYSATDSLAGADLRFLLLEDDVSGHHTRVTRDIITDTVTLTGQGSSQTFEHSFQTDPAWNTEKLHAVVFIQTADKHVSQAFSTYPTPDYNVRAMVPFSMMQIGPSTGTYEGEFFSVVNVALPDSYTMNIVVDESPPGWVVTYCDDEGHCYAGESSFALGTDEGLGFHAVIVPSSPGLMSYHFEVDSPELDSPLVVPFTYITDDIDALLVDDDGGEPFEAYFTAALDSAGKSYGLWDLAAAKLTEEVGEVFDLLIWNVGWSFPSLDEDDRAFLRDYLDDGGRLFLSGQDIGWDLNESNDNQDPGFYQDYLHTRYLRDDTNIYYLDGVPGDPVSDGLSLHIAGGDGANNQDYPSEIEAYDADAAEIFYYQGDGAGAVRSRDSDTGARVVYLAFGFEAIDNPTDRTDLMAAAVNWLQKTTDAHDGVTLPMTLSLHQNHPNPFGSSTAISFSLPEARHVDLAVYDAAGRRVRSLMDARQDAGSVRVSWDGTGSAGRALPSGVYFYRLSVDGGAELTRRCLLVR